MRKYWCIIFLLVAVTAFSQRGKDRDSSNLIHQVSRIEFNLEYDNNNFHLVSGQELGMLVAVETNDSQNNGSLWDLNHLDTTLNVTWTKILIAPIDGYLIAYDFYDGDYYLLFTKSRYDNTDLLLYKINSESSDIVYFEINTVFPISLSQFEVLSGRVLLAGNTNYKPVLLVYDFVDKRPKVIPGIYDKQGTILDLIMDDELGMFTVILSQKMLNKRYTVITKTFTVSGDLVQENIVNPGEKQNIVDGVATSFQGGFQYMAGTYSKKSATYSSGLYLAKFVNGRQQLVKYHPYSTLDNFFGYMSNKRESRLKKRIQRKAEKGKHPNFSYRLLVHEIIKRENEYLLVAEAYYPRYSTTSTYGSYGGGGGFAAPNFLGYNYTHAIVVAFDLNGNILWDNSFKIDNVLTFNLDKFITVNAYQDELILMYLDENVINSKIVSGDKIIEGKTFNPVRLAYENDEVKSKDPDIEGLKAWYSKTMFAYGEQRIKNDASEGGKVYRNIFYINKVQYQRGEASD